MSLRDYQRKRNFESTREPKPDTAVSEISRALFVVELHHARRLHFDFRLQIGNALKSWAAPKGPSYDPKVKRLTVEVEDHPMAYADFESEIEEGYGKGHVDQFDRGIWTIEGDPEHRDGWLFAGRVGTGFSDKMLTDTAALIGKKTSQKAPSNLRNIDPLLSDAWWITPTLVVEVNYRGIGSNELLRQSSLKTLRMAKRPRDPRNADRAPAKSASSKAIKRTSTKASSCARTAAHNTGAGAIAITHPDRVVFPGDNITKQQVADYYQSVMKWLLPGILGRPLSIIRCPEGSGKACFFQKHPMQGLHRVGLVRLKEEKGSQATYMYAKDGDSVMELVQFGTLEFHPWGATAEHPDRCDRVVFDLDPAPKVGWNRVVAAARLLKKWLDRIGLQSFLRTTGGKGLHVVVPLNPGCPWPQVKDFAHAMASTMAAAYPDEFVDTATKAKRTDKIFVDYLRNARGSTSVASYSLRARKGAPAATPLRWEELSKVERGDAFNIHTLPKRLARLRKDPWEGIDSIEQTLGTAIKQLNKR